MILVAIGILILLCIPAAAAFWGLGALSRWLSRQADELEGRTGKGSASQAPGSPGSLPARCMHGVRLVDPCAPCIDEVTPAVCGGHGPAGMRCDREPHADGRCEQNGIGWRCVTGQIPHDWQWAGDRRG